MKRFLCLLLAVAVSGTGMAQETRRGAARRGEAAGYASRDASLLSMMGWGIGIVVGIATLFALLDNNATHGGGGGGGNGGHTH